MNKESIYLWPRVFEEPSLVSSEDPRSLCASAMCAWANCMCGQTPPKSFGEVLVSIGKRLGMTKAATCENLSEHARAMGWLSDESKPA